MANLPPIHRWDQSLPRPRALVHVVHGMSEHGGRYARLAAALNRAGPASQRRLPCQTGGARSTNRARVSEGGVALRI